MRSKGVQFKVDFAFVIDGSGNPSTIPPRKMNFLMVIWLVFRFSILRSRKRVIIFPG